jgi:voltage-gated potassium channel
MNRLVKTSLRPVRNLAISIVVNVLGCAALFFFLERVQQAKARSLNLDFVGSLYWAVTTATTTGYGDYSPITTPGRLLGMWLMLSSVAMVAVATGQIAGAVSNDPNLFSKDEQEEMRDDHMDQIQMLCLLLEHYEIPVPAGVEEYHNKKGSANG